MEQELPDSAKVWAAALNQRVGLENAPLSQVYHEAFKRGISSTELYTLPEKDEYLYNTTRYDKPGKFSAMNCVVFVCRILKAGGVFGHLDFNCEEMSMPDLYKLKIFAHTVPGTGI